MSRIKYFETITNSRGDSLANYRVQVVDSAGGIVDIYRDEAGTRFQDAAGNIANFALAAPNGKAEFWWEPASGQILQVFDPGGTQLVDATDGFANKYVLTNLPGNVALNAVEGLDGALGGKVDNTELASTDAGKGAALVGFRQLGDGTASRTIEARARDTVSLNDFTGTPVAKFKAAMVQLGIRGGGTLEVPRASYSLDSTELGQPIFVPSNVTVELNKSIFTITGTAQINSVFRSVNNSNVTIRNGEFFGNSKATGYNDGALLNYVLDGTATADARNIRVEDLYLENFAANYWISVENTSSNEELDGVNIERIRFKSLPGNTYDADITRNASVVAVTAGGFINGTSGRIRNVTISDISGDASHIKSGVIVYHNVHNAKIEKLTILNAGYSGAIPDDSGAYALQVYDSTGLAEIVSIRNVTLSGRSCCAYIAGGNGVTIEDFNLFGQADQVNGTLPKGALVFNGTVNATAKNGRVRDSFVGYHLSGPSFNKRCNITLDHVLASENVAHPLRVEPFNGQPMNGVTILNQSRFETAGAYAGVIAVGDSAGAVLNDLTISESYFKADGFYGLDAHVSDLPHSSNNWKFKDSTFLGAAVGLRIFSMAGKIKVRTSDANVGGAAVGMQMRNCPKLDLKDVEALAGTNGVGLDLAGSTGTISGYTRVSGTTPIIGLGSEKPTHSGVKGDIVNAVNYVPAPAGDGQTQVARYKCQGGTEWRPVRETVDAA